MIGMFDQAGGAKSDWDIRESKIPVYVGGTFSRSSTSLSSPRAHAPTGPEQPVRADSPPLPEMDQPEA